MYRLREVEQNNIEENIKTRGKIGPTFTVIEAIIIARKIKHS